MPRGKGREKSRVKYVLGAGVEGTLEWARQKLDEAVYEVGRVP